MPEHMMSGRRWTRDTVVGAIRAEARAGHDLSYSGVDKRVPSLLRAAERVFGHWSSAVTAAGFDYESICKYRKWTRDRVITRIKELYERGADLSWRNVATKLDPPLAAATLHAGRFTSWVEALTSAGLDPEKISRYRRWSIARIQREMEDLAAQGVALDQETLLGLAPALCAAIYRIGGGLVHQRTLLERRLRIELPPLSPQEEVYTDTAAIAASLSPEYQRSLRQD